MNNYNYKLRTDLAFQNKSLKNTKTTNIANITIKKFKDEHYNYTNIFFSNLNTSDSRSTLSKIFKQELTKYLHKHKLTKKSSCLVIGLGNPEIASDSLGVKTLEHITATKHLKDLKLAFNRRSITKFYPDVTSNTGISTAKSIKALNKEINPDFIIIIDSLISGSVNYLNKLIQITDQGITPGSGVGSRLEEISTKNMKIPVIVIGIPTAIEASAIIKEALDLKTDEITFKKGYDLIVSPKDIDVQIKVLSKFLGEFLNEFLI